MAALGTTACDGGGVAALSASVPPPAQAPPSRMRAPDSPRSDPAGCPDDDDQGDPGTAWGLTFPPYDPGCDAIVASRADIRPWACEEHRGYMNWPVPRLIHEISWQDGPGPDASGRARWRSYAARFGYGHRAWRLDDADAVAALVPAVQVAAFEQLRDHTSRRAARTLLAYHVLARHGGVFVGDDLVPPSRAGEPVDLATRLPMRGAALVTALHARNVGHVSVYLTCELMAAAAGHPLFANLAEQGLVNVAANRHLPTHARYLTGAAFLSRQLAGVFTVIPYRTVQELGIFG